MINIGSKILKNAYIGTKPVKKIMKGVEQIWPEIPTDPTIDPPEITSGNPEIVVEFSSFSYQVTATNNPTSFSAENLPNGLSINSSTGLISGTAPEWGDYNVTVKATNGGGTTSKIISFGFTTTMNKSGTNYSAVESDYCTNPVAFQIYVNNTFIGDSTVIYKSDKITRADAGYYGIIGDSNYYYYDGYRTITSAGTCT